MICATRNCLLHGKTRNKSAMLRLSQRAILVLSLDAHDSSPEPATIAELIYSPDAVTQKFLNNSVTATLCRI
jgi:hypothetical protein